LREISVTGTRVEQPTDEVPASITVIDEQRMERTLTNNIRDLIRYEPNVSVTSDPNRFGATGFNIRGLTDNRVLTLVDGIRVPDYFDFGPGPFNVSTRNVIDLEAVKRVEILRGPASSLYGSDALGGVVSFITKDPKDYLGKSTRPWYASIKSGWAQADRSWNNTLTLAGAGDTVGGMLVYTRRDGHELETKGTDDSISPNRTVANPQDARTDNFLAKVIATPSANNVFRLTVERFSYDVATDILSLNFLTPRTSELKGDDEAERLRLSLDHEYRSSTPSWLSGLKWIVYYQENKTDEHSDETRINTTAGCSGTTIGVNTCLIPRDFTFEQKVIGANVQLESVLNAWNAGHRLVYGVDYAFTTTKDLRDATIFNLTTGTTSKSLAGDNFPVRDFPESDSQRIGIFVQDEIAFANGRLLVTPALRYDYYELNVKPDAIYLANTPPSVQASDFSDSALAPKLGALYKLTPAVAIYAQYSYGFRAPPFDDINAGFRNPIQSYALIPNPNLKSETSRGVEAGVRTDYGRARFGVAAFYNRYKDFIDNQAALICPGDPNCVPGFLSTFQSINRAKVRIWGVEAKGEYTLGRGWQTIAAVGYTRGDDLNTDQPINTINPLKAVAGLNYNAPADRYGGALTVTAVERQRHVDETARPLFKSPGFALLDLTAYWNVTKQLALTAGLFNIFDRKYWLWSDLWRTQLRPFDPGLERYTQPGRNAAVSLRYVF
jgi:hemoglobin/transferrin/lactoferrin receptor protein